MFPWSLLTFRMSHLRFCWSHLKLRRSLLRFRRSLLRVRRSLLRFRRSLTRVRRSLLIVGTALRMRGLFRTFRMSVGLRICSSPWIIARPAPSVTAQPVSRYMTSFMQQPQSRRDTKKNCSCTHYLPTTHQGQSLGTQGTSHHERNNNQPMWRL